ncbi:amidohydrolase family protein [Variovorax sp. HW608]|uniref:amidohydrolase family protein n=1 Tax=Variovorax sp. HW608 TaxID=1034889 RepID=UPI001E4C66BD|nr:amidohydrolase family protein [Variovorax sp. HW608]
MPEPKEAAITAVDSHAHVFVRGLPLAPKPRHAPDYDATLDDYLALLDGHGLSHAVLVQPSFLGTDNSFLIEALRAHPSRLRGVAVVEPSIGDDALRALDQAGICGIRLNLVGLPIPELESPPWRDLLARVRALDWHVELHLESQHLQRAAEPVLEAGCKLVVDHFGRPAKADEVPAAWLAAAAADGRTWVKLSGAYRNWCDPSGPQARAMATRLLGMLGAGRLLWGSDWPHTQHRDQVDYRAALAALADWVPDADTRHRILADNPAQLFRFSVGDPS